MIPLKDDIPSSGFPVVTLTIIAINIFIFVVQLSLGRNAPGFIAAFGATPYEISHFIDLPPYAPFPIVLTLLTSMFMHGGILHILGNMLYLWIFGDNVEDAMGSIKFLIFYLLCGIIAASTHIAIEPKSMVPMIGASGAISGVLGAYLLLYPRANIYTLITFLYFIKIVKLPSVIVLTIWIFFQLLSGSASIGTKAGHGGVAWFAHIGGFFAGLLLVNLFKKKKVRLWH